jgi:anthranilate synthase component 2
MLGVCLGHQSLGEAFGGRTVRAERIMHGKTTTIRHTGAGIFADLPSPFLVCRYHSLVSDRAVLPECLEAVAWSTEVVDADEVQGMRHRQRPLWGVQFHPESFFSEYGKRILENFLAL